MKKYSTEFYKILWTVHPMRKDKRTRPTRIRRRSKWASYLWEKEIERNRPEIELLGPLETKKIPEGLRVQWGG